MNKKKKMRVGFFGDFENARRAMQDEHNGNFDINKYINLIKTFIEKLNYTNVEMFIYGCFDATVFNHNHLYYLGALKKAGFKIINVPRKKNGKDRSDMSIAVDICKHLFLLDNIDHYVIFSGDSDFSYLMKTIKLHDKKVSIISLDNRLARELKMYANEVVSVDPSELCERPTIKIIEKATPMNKAEEDLEKWRIFAKAVISFSNYFKEKRKDDGFLSLSHFKDKYMADYSLTEEEFNTSFNNALKEGLIILDKRSTAYTKNLVSCIEPNFSNNIMLIINQEIENEQFS